jgi:hypothetical protein
MNEYRINTSDPESLSLEFIDTLLDGPKKRCEGCGEIKPAWEFHKVYLPVRGIRLSLCKECREKLDINPCPVCGKEFWHLKGDVKDISIWLWVLPLHCSQKCYYTWLRQRYG